MKGQVWSFSDCLWYLPCIFFVPVIGFWFKDSHYCSCLQRKHFSREMRCNCSVIFLPCLFILNIQGMCKLGESKCCMYSGLEHLKSKAYVYVYIIQYIFPKMLGLDVTFFAKFRNICRTFELLKGSQSCHPAALLEHELLCLYAPEKTQRMECVTSYGLTTSICSKWLDAIYP